MSDVTQCQICGNVTTDGRCVCVPDKPKAAPLEGFLEVSHEGIDSEGNEFLSCDMYFSKRNDKDIHVIEYSYAQALEQKCAELEAKCYELLMHNGEHGCGIANAIAKNKTLESRCQKLELALLKAKDHNSDALNGIVRGFHGEADRDVRKAQAVIKEALAHEEGEK